MKILMLRSYKQFHVGKRYDVDEWTGQQMIELKKAITVKDMREEDMMAKLENRRPRKPFGDHPL